MRTLFFLLCALPVLCLGQSSSSAASIQHQQAVLQLQQQVPKAKIVDLEALAAQQGQQHNSCSSCANKAASANQSASLPVQVASKSDLLAEQARLVNIVQELRQATPVDTGLLQKYRRALAINADELKAAEAVEIRQAKAAQQK